jgi:hypothetical protein
VLGKGISEGGKSGCPARCFGHDDLLQRATEVYPERMAETLDRFLLTLPLIILVHHRWNLSEIFPGLDISGLKTHLAKFSFEKLGMGITVFQLFS